MQYDTIGFTCKLKEAVGLLFLAARTFGEESHNLLRPKDGKLADLDKKNPKAVYYFSVHQGL